MKTADNLIPVLNAMADSTGMKLIMDRTPPYRIDGESKSLRKVKVASGVYTKTWPYVVESMVDIERQLAIILVHLIGDLYAVFLGDGENGGITIFLFDGSKCGLSPYNEKRFLPQTWLREDLYRSIAPGVKKAYTQYFHANKWEHFFTGPKYLSDYLERKSRERAEREAQQKELPTSTSPG